MDHPHEESVGENNLGKSSKPASSAANGKKNKSRPRPAGHCHVSFAPSVLADRPSTSRVTVVEEHGVYIDALGRRVAQPALTSEDGGGSRGLVGDDIPPCAVAAGKERITRSAASKHEKGHVGFAVDDEVKSTKAKDPSNVSIGNGEGQIQYDLLAINLGLLKCGYRYQTTVPIHAVQDGGDEHAEEKQEDVQYNIVEIGESLDPDLEVEAVSNASLGDGVEAATTATTRSADTCIARDHIQIRIAARRPGKYQSSFSVITAQTSLISFENKDTRQSQRHIVSVRVKATLLGKDQGKPQLKANIIKLGKLIGYDSDEETEWQGFPESDDGDGGDGSGGEDPSLL